MTKKQKIIYYTLLAAISLLFIMAAVPKLLSQQVAITGFATAGLPIWFMYCVGIGEILGVIGLWTKTFFRYAYEGLFIVLVGAIVTTAVFQSVVFALFPFAVAYMLATLVSLNKKYLPQA